MMTPELLRQADIVLSRCGRPVPQDPGLRVVAIPKAFKAWAVFAAAPSSLLSTVQVTVTGDTTWMLRAISSYITVPVGLVMQVQFPDGKFLFHNLADIRSIGGFGSWRYPFTQPKACPPGTKIQINFGDSAAGTAQAVPLLLEGAYYYHVKGNGADVRVRAADLASSLPRYVPSANENILAPCWAFGEGPQTPQGYTDDPGGFDYVSSVAAIDVGAATAKSATLQFQIDPAIDFMVCRMGFKVTADGGQSPAVGDLLVKIRDSSGYALTDDYVRYGLINNVLMLKDWRIRAGDTILCDFVLIDYSGAGNVYVQAFAHGVQRRKAA